MARGFRSLALTLAVVAGTAIAALALAGVAGAVPPCCHEPPPPPPPPPPRANLVISEGTVTAVGSDQWQVSYTVSNRGNASAPSFYVDTHQNGTTLLRSSAQASLAAGASRSETMTFPRTSNCYLPVRFTADSHGNVAESSEYDNVRWAVGQTGSTCATLPRYQVKAVSFHANDETGWDWAGSDEPYWIFSGVGEPGTALTTTSHVFGDIDTGDTASFGSIEGCLYLNCSGGKAPSGMGFNVELWEEDLGYSNDTLNAAAEGFRAVGSVADYSSVTSWLSGALNKMADLAAWINSWADDDLVATQTFAYAPESLASRLAAIGGSFDETRTYSDGDGDYTMTVRVTRVG
jgi:CARDB